MYYLRFRCYVCMHDYSIAKPNTRGVTISPRCPNCSRSWEQSSIGAYNGIIRKHVRHARSRLSFDSSYARSTVRSITHGGYTHTNTPTYIWINNAFHTRTYPIIIARRVKKANKAHA